MNSTEHVDEAERVLGALKTDKYTRTYISSVFAAYENNYLGNETDALRLLARYGKEAVLGALKLGILLGKFTDSEADVLTSALSSGKPYTIPMLDIRGTDLIPLGIKGEDIGVALKSLLYAVIDSEVENEKSALIGYLIKSI